MRRLFCTVSYICLLTIPEPVSAADCVKVPTCEELGYVTAAGMCSSDVKSLACPFDGTKVYCPEDCREYKLTSCDESKGSCTQCGKGKWKYESCKAGWSLSGYDCIENECSGYNSTSQSISGCRNATSCQKGKGTVFKCGSCYGGYSLDNGVCNKVCTYTSTSLPANCTAAPNCKLGNASGEKTYYASTCTNCKNGYSVSSGKCVANVCSGYNSTSSSISGCLSVTSCQKGDSMVYSCSQCYAGYNFNNGVCTKTCTYTATGLPSHCKEAPNCKLGSASGEKTYYDTTCTICEDGYEVDAATRSCKQKVYATGDVYYYNGSPIGVVFYRDENITKIISSNENFKSFAWESTPTDFHDFTSLYNCKELGFAMMDMNGKSNTQKIVDEARTKGYETPAASAALLYAPDVCPEGSLCGRGEWYLPSKGEAWFVWVNLDRINAALSSIGKNPISKNDFYFTSTEYGESHAWGFTFRFDINGNPDIRNDAPAIKSGGVWYLLTALEIKR